MPGTCNDSVYHRCGFSCLYAFLSLCIWNKGGKLWQISDCHLKSSIECLLSWGSRVHKHHELTLTANPLFTLALHKLDNWNDVCLYIYSRMIPGLWPGEEKQKCSCSFPFLQEPSPSWKQPKAKGEYAPSTITAETTQRSDSHETHRNQRSYPLLGFTNICKDASN